MEVAGGDSEGGGELVAAKSLVPSAYIFVPDFPRGREASQKVGGVAERPALSSWSIALPREEPRRRREAQKRRPGIGRVLHRRSQEGAAEGFRWSKEQSKKS